LPQALGVEHGVGPHARGARRGDGRRELAGTLAKSLDAPAAQVRAG
jgi:hypothetical protein